MQTFLVQVELPADIDPCEASEIAPLVRRYFRRAKVAAKVTVTDTGSMANNEELREKVARLRGVCLALKQPLTPETWDRAIEDMELALKETE